MRHILLLSALCVTTIGAYAQNVGIGTTTPTANLDVNGTVRLRSGAPAAGKVLTSDANGNATWSTASQPKYVLSNDAVDPDLLAAGYLLHGRVPLKFQQNQALQIPGETFVPISSFLEARTGAAIVNGYGSTFIVWGGQGQISSGERYKDGAIYEPIQDSWKPIPPMESQHVNRSSSGAAVVWTGGELIVWGGFEGNPTAGANMGYIYNPITNTWTPMNTANQPANLKERAYGYNPGTNEFIVWGGYDANNTLLNTGAKYNLNTNTWTTISTTNAPSSIVYSGFAVGGDRLIIFGGALNGNTSSLTNTAYIYNFVANTWTQLPTSGLSARGWAQVQFTGNAFVVWGGWNSTPNNYLKDGAVYSLSNNTWTAMSTTGAPEDKYTTSSAYYSDRFIVMNEIDGIHKYTLSTQTWTNLNTFGRNGAKISANYIGAFFWGGTAPGGTGYEEPYKSGKRMFWNTSTCSSYTDVTEEMYLFKKN